MHDETTMRRRELSDTQWKKLEPHLPPEKPPVGRSNKPHRPVIEAILWRLRTGAAWRDIPREKYGPWQTIYDRYNKWSKDGTWQRIHDALLEQAEEHGELDWWVHFVDGTSVRVHKHGCGAQKKAETRPSA